MAARNNSTVLLLGKGKSTLEILEVAYLSQITVITLLGNFLVIFAFIFGPKSIRTFTNYFVVNLSVSDLLVGCISLPFWVVFRIDASLISDTLYKFVIPFDVLTGITSILSLAAISLERILAVRFPCFHIYLTKSVVMVIIFATWLLGLILSMAMYAVPHDHFYIKVYTMSIFLVGFVLPLFIILVSYCVIFQSSMTMMKASNNTSVERELRIAKAIAHIIGLFVICWTPFFIVNMVYVFCEDCYKPSWPIQVSKMMHYSNSMSNFFVYSVKSPEFRRFFKKLLCPRMEVGDHGNGTFGLPLGSIDASRKISTCSNESTVTCGSIDASRKISTCSNESTVTCGSIRSHRFSTTHRLSLIVDMEE